MKKDFAVIGLGTFGTMLCRELSNQGANVIAIDSSEERVNAISEYVPIVYCCDCTQEDALKKLKLDEVDSVILALGENFEASILILVMLKELGVKHIIARAESESNKKVLLRLGADDVIDTCELAVNSLCGTLLNNHVTRFFRLTENQSVAEFYYEGKQDSESLQDMNLRAKYALNVLLIRREGRTITPSPTDCFKPGDSVVVFGTNSAIGKMGRRIK